MNLKHHTGSLIRAIAKEAEERFEYELSALPWESADRMTPAEITELAKKWKSGE